MKYRDKWEYLGLFNARLANLPPSDEAKRAERMIACYKDRLIKATNYYQENNKPHLGIESELERTQDAIGRILFMISPTEDK